jgi:NAD(P)-dependent dehydrogenase (short-subunit alcohol dehydrogenase family)
MGSRPVAFVTGASRGIGASTAVALARAGYDVAITARTVREGDGKRWHEHGHARPIAGSLETVAAEIEAAGTTPLPLAMDLLDRDAVAAAAQSTLDEFGRVDVLCNIGIYQGPGSGLILETPVDLFARHFEGDVFAPFVLLQKLAPAMIEQGGGTIVNMSSYVALNEPPGTMDENGWPLGYAAAKAAIGRFSGLINVELGAQGIVAYTVDPGFVAYGDEFDEMLAKYPGMPVSPPEASGTAIAWLVTSPDAKRLIHKHVYLPDLAQRHGLLPGWEGPGTAFPG